MLKQEPTVYIVDDDPSIRRALKRVIRAIGLKVLTPRHASQKPSQTILSGPRPPDEGDGQSGTQAAAGRIGRVSPHHLHLVP